LQSKTGEGFELASSFGFRGWNLTERLNFGWNINIGRVRRYDMGSRFFASVCLLLAGWSFNPAVYAASVNSAVLDAKKAAESKGFLFLTSRDEILAKAKQEGTLRAISSLDAGTFKPMMESFSKKYPFIKIRMDEIGGPEALQRFLLELKAGTVKDFDTSEASSEFYIENAAHAMKFDILSMAQQGVLAINPKMIDPTYRNLVSVASTICSIAYNKNRIAADQVPDKWEDFLKPEFKGRKFVADIRTQCMASLVAGMGEEWVIKYARQIKEQQPVWVRGNARALAAISTGEQALHQMTFYNSCVDTNRKDPTKSLVCKILEPTPVHLRETQFILKSAPHPHAALLFIEHMASQEGQKVIDDYEPIKSSVYTDGEVARLTKGKKVSVNDHRTFQNTPKWMKMVVDAYGFPRAEK
jgi:iron(III) transport system substrate-binding protein